MCRSKFSDEDIGLIPEEEFMSSAPEQFKEGCEDPHKRMLQRLEHEKYLRIEVIKAVDEEKSRRDALVAKAAQQKANLSQIEVCNYAPVAACSHGGILDCRRSRLIICHSCSRTMNLSI